MKYGTKDSMNRDPIGLPATIALTASLLGASTVAGAAHLSDLQLECGGRYTVLESKAYYKSNDGTRALPQAGTREKIRVLSLDGPDCDILASDYGIQVEPGSELPYGILTGEDHMKAVALAEERSGETFEFNVVQSFSYSTNNGDLPLFPLVHEEQVSLLGLHGKADAGKLYGTPALEDLSDSQKAKVLKLSFSKLEWGKALKHSTWIHSDWLDLVLDKRIEPAAGPQVLDYIDDLKLAFQNSSTETDSFVTFQPGALIGARLNELLNAHGGGKFQDKLTILKREPMLFDRQILTWGGLGTPSRQARPELTAHEIKDVLTAHLDQAQRLANVPELSAARIRLAQFKTAARSILQHSKFFELTAESEALVNAILELK